MRSLAAWTVQRKKTVHKTGATPNRRDSTAPQSEMEIPVWGWSEPGTTITVEFAGQTKSVVANGKGDWMVNTSEI